MKTYSYQKTKSPILFRVVDLEGNWKEYWNSKTKQFKRGLTTVLGRVWPKGEGFLTALKNTLPSEWEKKLDKASDEGDAIHQLIDLALSGLKPSLATDILAEDNKTLRKPTLTEWMKYLSFVDFFNAHGIIVANHEWTAEHDLFVCTIDQIWTLTKSCGRDKRYCRCAEYLNLLGVNDVKTGKGLYANHKIQIAMETRADHGAGEVKYTMLLHLNGTERGWSTKFFNQEETTKNWQRGMSAFDIDDDTYKPFDPQKDIEEIPETAELIFGKPAKETKEVKEPPKKRKVVKVKRKKIN